MKQWKLILLTINYKKMGKRFTDTNIWGEDWFLEMPNEYKLFWYYMLCNCDHAGIFKVNMRSFCSLNEVKLTSNKVLDYFNNGKQRIRELQSNVWFIEDFSVIEYCGGEMFLVLVIADAAYADMMINTNVLVAIFLVNGIFFITITG